MKEYNKANIPLAKTLRKNMTPWERKPWYDFLRNYPVRRTLYGGANRNRQGSYQRIREYEFNSFKNL